MNRQNFNKPECVMFKNTTFEHLLNTYQQTVTVVFLRLCQNVFAINKLSNQKIRPFKLKSGFCREVSRNKTSIRQILKNKFVVFSFPRDEIIFITLYLFNKSLILHFLLFLRKHKHWVFSKVLKNCLTAKLYFCNHF